MAGSLDPSGVQKLLELFHSASSADNNVQKQVFQQLEEYHNMPEYGAYLTQVFVREVGAGEEVRMRAGIQLKNNILKTANMTPQVLEHIRTELPQVLADPSARLRRTGAAVISAIVSRGSLDAWPSLTDMLLSACNSGDVHARHGAFVTISILSEDLSVELDDDRFGKPLVRLLPILLKAIEQQDDKEVRLFALKSVNCFTSQRCATMETMLSEFVHSLNAAANDADARIKKEVCRGLVAVSDRHLDILLPNIHAIVQYMLATTQSEEEDVALEACEFWSAIAETRHVKDILRDHLPQLCPTLLKGMVYNEMDRGVLEAEDEDDAAIPDEEHEIRPRFHRARESSAGGEGGSGGTGSAGADDDDEDDDDDNGEVSEWNLRKSSASALDILSGAFENEMLVLLLPLVEQRMASQDWAERESAILAIGAIADGCFEGMCDYLPRLVPFLLHQTQDAVGPVRGIACWTLSRYSNWIVAHENDQTALLPVMDALLKRVVDKNKKVQEAACSAFATLEEEAGPRMEPYLTVIVPVLLSALEKYQKKNSILLYDALGTLADGVGAALDPYMSQILHAVVARWQKMTLEDANLVPCLECLASLSASGSDNFKEFSADVFRASLSLLESYTVAAAAAEHTGEKINRDVQICALDLISSLLESNGKNLESQVASSNLLRFVSEAMKDPLPDVRQSSCALVGDLVKSCLSTVKPALNELFPLLLANINSAFISVCNNACWAIGEIAVAIGQEISPVANQIVDKTAPILRERVSSRLRRSLHENVVVCLGRLTLASPGAVIPRAVEFFEPFCLRLCGIRDDVEKDHASMGMCTIIKANPNAVQESLVYICDAIASWYEPPPHLAHEFKSILEGYRDNLGAHWNEVLQTFDPALIQVLTRQYGV